MALTQLGRRHVGTILKIIVGLALLAVGILMLRVAWKLPKYRDFPNYEFDAMAAVGFALIATGIVCIAWAII